jgi:hypothetical protein
MAVLSTPGPVRSGWRAALDGRYHKLVVMIFTVIVIAHWAEHLVQAAQIWVLGWPTSRANGVLGVPFPWLIKTEWLHYGFAVVMLAFLWFLKDGFTGRSRRFWIIALAIQFWHHIEHLLLLLQAMIGVNFFGADMRTSVLQTFFPRVELHLFYNAIVTIPMIIAIVLHRNANEAERAAASCTCAPPRPVAAGRAT